MVVMGISATKQGTMGALALPKIGKLILKGAKNGFWIAKV